MKKFMVLYMASGADFEKMMKNSTPEQQKKGMDGWMKWMEQEQEVDRRRRSAARQDQARRRERCLEHEERHRWLFDRPSTVA